MQASRELGAALVAFSPPARGILAASPPDPAKLPQGDIGRAMPRFTPEHYADDLALRGAVAAIADDVGCSLAQLALRWVLAQGEHVVAIPGTRSVTHLRGNWKALAADAPFDSRAAAGPVLNDRTMRGVRYVEATLAEIDTESCGRAG